MKRGFYRGSGRVKRRLALVLAILIAFASTMADVGYAYAVGLSFSEDKFEASELTASVAEAEELTTSVATADELTTDESDVTNLQNVATETLSGQNEPSIMALTAGSNTDVSDNVSNNQPNYHPSNPDQGQPFGFGDPVERNVWFAYPAANETKIVPLGESSFTNRLYGTNDEIVYTSTNPNVEVDNSGKVTLVGHTTDNEPEVAEIHALAKGDGLYYKDTDIYYTIVFQGKNVITIGDVSNCELGDVLNVPSYAFVTNGRDSKIIYSVANNSSEYAWIDNNEKIHVSNQFNNINTETAEVTIVAQAMASSDGRYAASDLVTTTFSVSKKKQDAPVYIKKGNLYVGQKIVYPVSFVQGANGEVVYTSDNSDVAKVNRRTGEITAISPGTANITVTKKADQRFTEASSALELEVLPPVASVDTYNVQGTQNTIPDKRGNYWYRGLVNLCPQIGYWISVSRQSFEEGNIALMTEGASSISFYAYDVNNDATTDVFETETIYIDATAPEISVEQPKESHLYNKTAQFDVKALDSTSGLFSLTYEAKLDGSVVKSGDISMDDVEESFNGVFDSLAEDDGRYEITFAVTDYAGNVTEKDIAYKINTVLPEISVSMNDAGLVRKNADGLGYYSKDRTAVITVLCDSECFNGEKAKRDLIYNAISIKKKNGEENPTDSIVCSAWTHTTGATSREDKHEITVTFKGDGIYDWAPAYTDEAGNYTNVVNYGESSDAVNFVLDKSKPTGTVSAVGKATWRSLVNTVKYETFLNSSAKISSTGDDEYSEIYKIDYYVQRDDKALSEAELMDISANEWISLENGAAPKGDHYIIYARIEDYAGNKGYISTDGLLYDDTAPTVSLGGIDGNVHNTDVVVSVTTKDTNSRGMASGLANVTYTVSNGSTTTDSGVLYTAPDGTIPLNAIVSNSSSNVSVSATANNTNDTTITVTVTDRAGNSSTATGTMMFDVVKPTVKVTYDNNSGVTSYGPKAYFKASRTARIEITERNFTEGGVSLVAKNYSGVAPIISGWSSSGSGDGRVNVATVTFAEDGDYEFSIGCSDAAGNASEGVNFGNALSPSTFVVDKTKPVINVTYDNNSYLNGNYYDMGRVATVRVTERNFNADKIVFTSTAVDNGIPIQAPALATVSNSGDVHTMSVPFNSDAHYNWSFAFTDMAGNEADINFSDDFDVDTTMPAVSLTGVLNKSVNDGEEVGFNLTVTDTNSDLIVVKLESVIREEKNFVKKQVELKTEDIRNGKKFSVDNLPEDGVYTLYLEATDLAGNSYNSVKYDGGENEPVNTSSGESTDVITTFTVNREGSVFWMDDDSLEAVGSYYVQSVPSDLVIYEVNADRLNSHELMVNGALIKEGKDYTVTEEHGDNSWYKYEYSINGALFDKEGEYNIVASSVDKISRTSYSDVKNLEIAFDVDKTAPTVTLAGLENNGRYKTSAQTVTVMPLDDGGKVGKLSVKVNNNDGEIIATPFSMEGEELNSYLEANAGTVEFAIPEGVKLSVDIECEDMAKYPSNAANKTVYRFENITVSENAMVIFWASAKNIVIALGAVAVVGAGATVGFLRFRKVKVK